MLKIEEDVKQTDTQHVAKNRN